MTTNGDRPTPVPPKEGDWRSEAFKLEEVPDPYRTQLMQSALRELDEQVQSVESVLDVRVRAWEKSIDRRIAAAVDQTAEEVAARLFTKIQRELSKVHERLDAAEAATESALGRAEKAVEQSGQYRPVVVNVVDHQAPEELPSDPAVPNLSRWEATKKHAKKPTTIIGIVVAIVYAVVNAWMASKH